MSDHEEDVSNSINDIKTKNKHQNAKRQYGCPCGKEYLSYPALFTHIKQKHGGKAPGQLKKPKTEKARGRPRLPTVVKIYECQNMQEDNSIEQYSPQDELKRILAGLDINYSQTFEPSQGNKTCQDMATIFLNEQAPEQSNQRKVLICFLNYMKYFTNQKFSQDVEDYWTESPPTDLIDVSNQMVRELQQNQDRFPLTRELLIQLLFVLFRWMYKNKWTDHKLVKRNSDNSTSKNA